MSRHAVQRTKYIPMTSIISLFTVYKSVYPMRNHKSRFVPPHVSYQEIRYKSWRYLL